MDLNFIVFDLHTLIYNVFVCINAVLIALTGSMWLFQSRATLELDLIRKEQLLVLDALPFPRLAGIWIKALRNENMVGGFPWQQWCTTVTSAGSSQSDLFQTVAAQNQARRERKWDPRLKSQGGAKEREKRQSVRSLAD